MSLERQEHSEISPWWGEHTNRYYEVLKYIKPGNTVLDLACGNGYGTNILGSVANVKVTGGDISEETLAICKKRYSKAENLEFKFIDATEISYPDNHFDVIASFETIEHTTKYEQMVKELSRVLKRGGVLLLSTPNSKVTSPDGKIINPYHTQEFSSTELEVLLKPHFEQVTVYGQDYIRYKGKTEFKYKMAHFFETLFYKRGLRKIAISVQDAVIHSFIKTSMYPTDKDFDLTSDLIQRDKCNVLYAICHKSQ